MQKKRLVNLKTSVETIKNKQQRKKNLKINSALWVLGQPQEAVCLCVCVFGVSEGEDGGVQKIFEETVSWNL